MDREERVDEREEGAGERGDPEPELPRLELVGREDPEEGAGEHHSLEPDVRDPAALGEDPAHRRERERGRVAEHGGEERRPDDDLVEVGDARPGREIAEPDPCRPGDDGAPAQTLGVARDGVAAEPDRHEPEQDREDRRADVQRRQRQPERRETGEDAGDGDCTGSVRQAREQALDHS